MDKTGFRAVEMTRRIRAEHAEQLQGASGEERIRFYREKARELNEEVEARRNREAAETSGR